MREKTADSGAPASRISWRGIRALVVSRGMAAGLLLSTLGACHTGPPSDPLQPLTPAEPVRDDVRPQVPEIRDGTLASVHGTFGLLEVTQHEGRRSLLIDGVVQGSSAVEGNLAPQDALVELIATSHEGPGRAVVLGLGTGSTARALTGHGYDVRVAEREPEVIALAREWFGYDGHAAPIEGLAFLEAHDEAARVVLVDAFDGTDPPAHLLDDKALATYRKRLGADGVLALRMLGRPSDPGIRAAVERLGRRFHFAHLLGSGVGDEPQNLYVVASESTINLVMPKGLPVRPLWMNRGPGLEVLGGDANRNRMVIAGYVIAMPETGRLALDLAHAEMGAVRFLISGPAEVALSSLVSDSGRFPTAGDIESDASTRGTLVGLAGGGGVKRSDVRMSPVVAAVRGTASVVAVVHPDTVFGGRPLRPGGESGSDLERAGLHADLPYGGVLYELEGAEVEWTIDAARWKKLERGPLDAPDRRARAALRKGDLRQAAAQLDVWLEVVRKNLGPEAVTLLRVASVATVQRQLARAVDERTPSSEACEAALRAFSDWGIDPLQKALRRCAGP